jgi:hypothetical protein
LLARTCAEGSRLLSARHHLAIALLAGALAAAPAHGEPRTYTAAGVPVAAGQGTLEFPLAGAFRAEVGLLGVTQGALDGHNPFSYLGVVTPWAWLHYDGIRNLRLSGAFQELWQPGISSQGVPESHEERFMVRARLQQPLGNTALYQMLQLDLRSLEDPAGNHQFVFRTRARIGVGLNLDAARIHSLTLYEEATLRFGSSAYISRAFDFYQTVVGYTWTTRRGIFVTAAMLGEVSLSPAGNQLTFLYGPVLALAYRILPPAEMPPEPPTITPQ